jgi:hypothetical protein
MAAGDVKRAVSALLACVKMLLYSQQLLVVRSACASVRHLVCIDPTLVCGTVVDFCFSALDPAGVERSHLVRGNAVWISAAFSRSGVRVQRLLTSWRVAVSVDCKRHHAAVALPCTASVASSAVGAAPPCPAQPRTAWSGPQ